MLECQRLQPKPNDERIKVQVFTNIHPKKNRCLRIKRKNPRKKKRTNRQHHHYYQEKSKRQTTHTRAKKPDQNHNVPKTEPSKAN